MLNTINSNRMILLIILVVISNSFCLHKNKLQTFLVISDPITANATSASVASGDLAATVVDASAQATTGHTATSIAGGVAQTDSVKTQSAIAAVAQASESDKLVQANSHEETAEVKTTGQQGNANADTITSTDYNNSTVKKTALDDTVTVGSDSSFQIGANKTLTDSQEVITDVNSQKSDIQTQTASNSNLNQANTQDIVITINTGSDKLIIEKLISKDDRVIIVSAARYLQSSLQSTDQSYIKSLIAGSCNCKQVKDYVIEMLAQAD